MSDDDIQKLADKITDFKNRRESEKKPPQTRHDQGSRAVTEFFAHIFAGGFLGHMLDKTIDSGPAAFLLFIILGIITGCYRLQMIIKYDKDDSIGFAPLQNDKKNARNAPENNEG